MAALGAGLMLLAVADVGHRALASRGLAFGSAY
jgi:hypothetical protein